MILNDLLLARGIELKTVDLKRAESLHIYLHSFTVPVINALKQKIVTNTRIALKTMPLPAAEPTDSQLDCAMIFGRAGVAEWQTRRTQNPLVARPCGFDSLLRHHHFPDFLRKVLKGQTLRSQHLFS